MEAIFEKFIEEHIENVMEQVDLAPAHEAASSKIAPGKQAAEEEAPTKEAPTRAQPGVLPPLSPRRSQLAHRQDAFPSRMIGQGLSSGLR